MPDAGWLTALAFATDLLIRLGLSVRVIMRRLPVGVSYSWLFIVLVFPFVGALAYLLFGELRLGRRRAERAAKIHEPYQLWLQELNERADVDWSGGGPHIEPLAKLIQNLIGIPPLGGTQCKLLPNWKAALQSLIDDIDAAQRTCHLEFYIWNEGGLADQVAEALIRAAQRGVTCRVLVDDVGSKAFLKCPIAGKLRGGGVQLHSALNAGLLRMAFVRFDLRMHRKIVVIDGRTAYTGSLNLVDPRYFKQDAGVGEWVDAMVRIEGPAVEPMAITFLEDWALESGESLKTLEESGDVHPLTSRGAARVQVIPSGPAQPPATMQRILLSAIYVARREITLTSPYFVPDEFVLSALLSASQRGVTVTLILPAKVDSLLVRHASQAFLGDLAEAGVRVFLFEKGLLHTKSITIDGELCLFGSLNLDPRSLNLNFEITLAIYDREFCATLVALQESYREQSKPFDLDGWRNRTRVTRFLDDTTRLVGPLL